VLKDKLALLAETGTAWCLFRLIPLAIKVA
jgi:hypothetical protein